jgi:hypothetical protein
MRAVESAEESSLRTGWRVYREVVIASRLTSLPGSRQYEQDGESNGKSSLRAERSNPVPSGLESRHCEPEGRGNPVPRVFYEQAGESAGQ